MMLRNRQSQQGLGLATALFVITVMALVAVLITQLVKSNAQGTAEEVMLVRAFYAAQAGVQYGLNKALPPNGTASLCPAAAGTQTFTPVAMTVEGLQQCTAIVECATLPVTNAKPVYTLTSRGTCGAVSRTIQVRAQ
jgi:MSHA biogenesis protein MshP